MQGRMKQHQLNRDEILEVLNDAQVGRIATNNTNGFPYIVPVHFVYLEDKIYVHGLVKGQKISNILDDSKVGFEVDEMVRIIPDENAVCDTNTEFKSVIILGEACMLNDNEIKKSILKHIVKKYTPELSHLEFPDKMLKATGIIEIRVVELTGKYYK